jgi:hypothetical protein
VISLTRLRSLKLCMCFLVVAGTMSTSIQHCHAGGGLVHTHGMGLDGARQESRGAMRGKLFAGITCRHFHFVLMGFEIYGGEAASEAPLPVCLWAHEGATMASCFCAQAIDGLAVAGHSPADVSIAPLPELAGLFGHDWPQVAAGKSTTDSDATPAAGSVLCDRARGERSGVGRI